MVRSKAFLLLVVGLLLIGCGSTVDVAESGSQGMASEPLDQSDYLAMAFAPGFMMTAVQAVDGGAIVLGGSPSLSSGSTDGPVRLDPVSDVVLVREDGMVDPLPAPPTAEPLFNVSMAERDRVLTVVGVTCSQGTAVDDVGGISCLPGDPRMVQLDLDDRVWTELSLPPGTPAPAGLLKDQAVHMLEDGGLVYEVWPNGGAARGRRAWVRDRDETWRELEVPEDHTLCGSDGELLAVSGPGTAVEIPAVGGTAETMSQAESVAMGLQQWKGPAQGWIAIDESVPDISAIPGSVGVSCAGDVGVVVTALTGQDGSEVAWFSPANGWQSFTEEGAGMLGTAVPSSGPSLIIEQVMPAALLVLPDRQSAPVEIPPGHRAIVGVGAHVLTVDARGTPNLILLET